MDCGPPTVPTNGLVDTPNGATFGSTSTYTCDTGYALSGSQSRSCGADGNWTSSEQVCEGVFEVWYHYMSLPATIAAVDCGQLTDPDNGLVDTSYGTTFRSTATYTCDTGYALSGSQTRSCGADGNWTSSEPFCEGVF